MVHYPEHEKLSKVKEESQFLGEFLEWSQSKGMFLATRQERSEHNDYEGIIVVNKSINTLLSEFLDIDLVKLENEKLHMLESCRALNVNS